MTGSWFWMLLWAMTVSALHVRGRRELVRAARVSHEIRGPLSTAQLALAGLEPSARVDAIALELRRAALAVDELSGRPREAIGPIDVGRLLADSAELWRALAAAHGATLAVEPGRDVHVIGDRLRLIQACANLVGNAIEHGCPRDEPAGLVRVSSSAVAGRVLIEVRDFGPGLPAPLSQLIAAARGRRSARGHGLAIAAAIAERHGGRLASFPADRGARLVLDLPEVP